MADTDLACIVEDIHSVAKRRALRAIAIFEAAKGIAALAAIIGMLDLMHHDVRHLAMELIGHFGLNPDARYPSILLHYADLLPGANVRSPVFVAFGYILARLLEAYGLWNDRAWGEWPGALAGWIARGRAPLPVRPCAPRHRRSQYYRSMDIGIFIEQHDYLDLAAGSAIGGETFVVLAGFAGHRRYLSWGRISDHGGRCLHLDTFAEVGGKFGEMVFRTLWPGDKPVVAETIKNLDTRVEASGQESPYALVTC